MSDARPLISFADRVAVIATMHGKEQVITPHLQQLGIQTVVPPEFDSDRFGTFTRDVSRPADQLQTARLKAEAAMGVTGHTLGLASEGSFGPHPSVPFLACDREIVLLIDREHDLEIVGQVISTQTNYSHAQVRSLAEAWQFAEKAGFPQHGLVAMPDRSADAAQIIKGIISDAQFTDAVTEMLNRFGQVHLETDMRAMHNPTRMQVILQATQDLVRKLNQRCPDCDTPGFDITDWVKGLPCQWCGQPTQLPIAAIYQCRRCGYRQEDRFPDRVEAADPGQCNFCNP